MVPITTVITLHQISVYQTDCSTLKRYILSLISSIAATLLNRATHTLPRTMDGSLPCHQNKEQRLETTQIILTHHQIVPYTKFQADISMLRVPLDMSTISILLSPPRPVPFLPTRPPPLATLVTPSRLLHPMSPGTVPAILSLPM